MDETIGDERCLKSAQTLLQHQELHDPFSGHAIQCRRRIEEEPLSGTRSAAGTSMSDQLHVQQGWEQVLAGGLEGRSQLASLYSELQWPPQKEQAQACQSLSPRQPADWEWATAQVAQRPGELSQQGLYQEHRQRPSVRVVDVPAVDEAGQSALQAALLCQILQHSQYQNQQQQPERLLQMARQAAMQADVAAVSAQASVYKARLDQEVHHQQERLLEMARQATQGMAGSFTPASACAGNLNEDLQQRMASWRAARHAPSSAGSEQHSKHAETASARDPRQQRSAGMDSAGSGPLVSAAPAQHPSDARVSQGSSVLVTTRPIRSGRVAARLAGAAPAQHADAIPAYATAAPARRPSEARRPLAQPSMASAPSQDMNSHAKQIQPCHCKKSMCLKLYCDCFASGHYCGDTCVCHNCHNTQDHKDLVTQTIAYTRSRNPASFEAKRALARGEHIKGCNCKNSRCLKKYCECFLAKARCSSMCRCIGCANQAPDAAEPDQPKKAAKVAPQGTASRPAQQAPPMHCAERFPLPDAYMLEPSKKAKEVAEGGADKRSSVDGTSASEAGTVFARSTTPSPSQEHLPTRLRSSRSVTDDALSPSTLHRTTFPAAKFTELGEQADFFDAPATSAAMSAAAAPAAKQGDANNEWPFVQAGIPDIAESEAEAKLPGLTSLRSFLDPLGGADASATLSLMPKGGHHMTEGPLSGFPRGPLQKTVSDAFNEGEAAEWLLRLG